MHLSRFNYNEPTESDEEHLRQVRAIMKTCVNRRIGGTFEDKVYRRANQQIQGLKFLSLIYCT